MPEMSEEAKKGLSEFNAAQTDWYTTCPLCQSNLKGTLVELKAHSCKKEGKNGA